MCYYLKEMGISGGKGGAGLEKQLSCPKVHITFDTFSEILQSLNLLQKIIDYKIRRCGMISNETALQKRPI